MDRETDIMTHRERVCVRGNMRKRVKGRIGYLPATESTSSMKIIVPFISSQASKILANFFSLSPYHFDTKSSSFRCTNGRSHRLARIRAVRVFPVPGGPSNSTALGRLLSKDTRVLRAIRS